MPTLKKVTFREGKVSIALSPQREDSIYPYGFPFTLNLTMGCFFCCKFCYSPVALRQNIQGKRNSFFEEVNVRLGVPEKLNKELTKYSPLPQHLKRVQINEHSDYYLPKVMRELKDNYGRDLMLEVLEIFRNHWNEGNGWMLHILTKSPFILNHIDILKEMAEMVQVEISFSTPYENQLRDLELSTPTIKKRLETIEKLSNEGIFVRVMAMPFYGDKNDLSILKQITFDSGAQAIKNKGINYYDWNDVKNASYNDLIQDNISQTGSRQDTIIDDTLTIKSGEEYLVNGKPESVKVLMPNRKYWNAMSMLEERMVKTELNVIDCGYDQINTVDWEYIK